jgi:CrcB protein
MSSLSPLSATLHVALGGAIGAGLRYQAGQIISASFSAPEESLLPLPTLAVNILGSFLIGVLAGWLASRGAGPAAALHTEQWRLLLGAGVLGGFTTFSAFSLELVMMIERGQYTIAGLYAALSLAFGIGAFIAGIALMRFVLKALT